jgi:hypothetical protein
MTSVKTSVSPGGGRLSHGPRSTGHPPSCAPDGHRPHGGGTRLGKTAGVHAPVVFPRRRSSGAGVSPSLSLFTQQPTATAPPVQPAGAVVDWAPVGARRSKPWSPLPNRPRRAPADEARAAHPCRCVPAAGPGHARASGADRPGVHARGSRVAAAIAGARGAGVGPRRGAPGLAGDGRRCRGPTGLGDRAWHPEGNVPIRWPATAQ